MLFHYKDRLGIKYPTKVDMPLYKETKMFYIFISVEASLRGF